MKKYFIIALSLLAVSCSEKNYDLIPSGVLISENRVINSSFSKIKVSNGFSLKIFQDSTIPLLIEADNNIIQHIETYVEDSTLILKIRDGIDITSDSKLKTVNVTMSVDKLNSIESSGGSAIFFKSFINQNILAINTNGGGSVVGSIKCSEISLSISGGGTVNINGSCEMMNCNFTGGGKLHSFDFITENIAIDISGGSLIEIYANKNINVENAAGGSKIYYKGDAQVTTSNITGGSIIQKQ